MSATLEKVKPSRLKRELIPFVFISIITISSLIYFSYQDSTGSIEYSSGVPIVNIEVSNEITNYSQQCFIKISPVSFEFIGSNWAERKLAANIRKRNSDGGFSFELFQPENFFQIRNDDDWLLLPQGKNLNSLRTKMAFDVYNMLKEDNSDYLLPHSKLVEVYKNGIYQGLYLLSERIDRKLMNLDQENDMIFKITDWDGDFFSIPNNTSSPWEQLHPDIVDFSQIPINLTQFIQNTSEEDFFNEEHGIFTIFEKSEIIDNLLFGLLTGHEIIEGSSYYLMYNQKKPAGFFFLPWNFAQSWGFSKDGSIPDDIWLNKIENEIDSVCWSKLYHRLLFPSNPSINDEFVSEIKNRWGYIRSNLWENYMINDYLNSLYSTILNTLFRTNTDNVYAIRDAIKSWFFTRFNLLDNIFNEQGIIFYDNFKSPYREDDEIFGFSSPAARRHYFKSSLLFSTQKIHEVSVVIQSDYLHDMIYRKGDFSRLNDRRYMRADVSIDDYSMDNVGFRIRGNYNKNYPKDSFKLKFSEDELYLGKDQYREDQYEYIPENENRRFLGLRRLNLRAAPIDFSLMNEVAGYEIYKILGYPCPRISWAKLYIIETDESGNVVKPKEYKGLYLLTEDIDKTFLNYNFKNPEGNLYKTTDIPANLKYKANLKEFLTYDYRRIYELRTNELQDDYSDLEEFIYSINFNWSDIQNFANITLLGKYFAASNFIGNWDDYVFLSHNYFLYSDPNYGFVLLPWDIEMSINMGTNSSIVGYVNPYSPNFITAPLLSGYKGYFDGISAWAQIDPDPRPLWDNSINDPDFIDPYLNSHEKIVKNMNVLVEKIEQWFDFIQPTALLPFQYTDQYPNPIGAWILNIEPGWFYYEKTRVLTFLQYRTQYVETQIPLLRS
ncbi:MAG: CotH kinase family protein [Promethearchaeota archaeon]|jgi:spore coat protein CotH